MQMESDMRRGKKNVGGRTASKGWTDSLSIKRRGQSEERANASRAWTLTEGGKKTDVEEKDGIGCGEKRRAALQGAKETGERIRRMETEEK